MSDLIKKVEEASKERFSAWRFVELAGFGVGVANLPLGIAMIIGSTVAEVLSHKRQLSETKMSDEWLKEVAESQYVSPSGLAFLAKCVEKNGFVSAKDAVSWVELERKLEIDRQAAQKKTEDLASPGARALLERARKECVGLVDPVSLKQALDAIPTIRDAASNMADVVMNEAGGLLSKAATVLKGKLNDAARGMAGAPADSANPQGKSEDKTQK